MASTRKQVERIREESKIASRWCLVTDGDTIIEMENVSESTTVLVMMNFDYIGNGSGD